MLFKSYGFVVGLLADRRVCRWNSSDTEIAPKIMNENPVVMLKVCPWSDILVALTSDNHVVIGTLILDKLIDITDTIYESINKDSDCVIDEIYVDRGYLLVRIENDILHANISRPHHPYSRPIFSLDSITVHKLQHSIDLVSFGFNHCIIRTSADPASGHQATLMSMGTNEYCKRGLSFDEGRNIGMQKINICYARHINQVVCNLDHTLLLMDDGSVLACGRFHGNQGEQYTGSPFTPVQFPKDTYITRIISNNLQTFYITSEGLCYHTSTNHVRMTPYNASYCLHPTLVYTLRNYFVDNVFILGSSFIIQDNAGKLYWLLFADSCFACSIQDVLQPLPFFDDKCITVVTSITSTYTKYYFIAADGKVYCCNYHTTIESHVESVSFFDDNPIAVESNAARIRSATNTVGPHQQN